MNTCTNDDIKKLLVEAEALPEGKEVAVDAPLNQAGVQSLEKFNLFLLIEERFEIEIPDQDFAALNTIADIVGYIAKKQTNAI